MEPMMWSVITLCASLLCYVAAEQLELIDTPVSFSEAEKECVAKGGHLASIHDRNHNDRLKDKCRGSGTQHNCWIGLKNDGQGWKWTDGTTVDYTFWHAGNPTTEAGAVCAALIRQYSDRGEWISEQCDAPDTKAVAICSIGGSQNPNTGHTSQPVTSQPLTPNPGTSKPVTMAVTDIGKVAARNGGRLKIQGTHFEKDGQRVFLSGVNLAWIAYGYDFGDGQYQKRRARFENYLKLVSDNGGNSIRVWVHIEGATSPHFDSNGNVLSLDQKGTFLSDMHEFLESARKYNVLVFFCLWNAAVKQNHANMDGLIKDMTKLQSYLDNALIPWVKAVKDEPAMGGWDIINEMEGEMKKNMASTDPCYDTTILAHKGTGWAGQLYSPQEFQRFINRQIAAIKSADPEALVTVGSGSDMSNKLGSQNYYSDTCLIKSGGQRMGTLSFYSVHSYDWQGKFPSDSPFLHSASEYGADRPIIIGEFSQVKGAGMKIEDMFQWAYDKGYAGAWSWQALATGGGSDTIDTQTKALLYMRNKDDQSKGGLVAIKL
ncbi:mannan endo-1,4-beta-mannosidase-like isoform X1 [Haliotis rubra]|uniref:mannan endo-1,4-beta-mannosidase-like isoform X1 n=1 Tax=Haliotis rubra TaxID=36100 RepID=UPI001EE5817D|nr:mannan endo-1,4-beta-mannosidase-like isoform X1 [Haliotis rubra]